MAGLPEVTLRAGGRGGHRHPGPDAATTTAPAVTPTATWSRTSRRVARGALTARTLRARRASAGRAGPAAPGRARAQRRLEVAQRVGASPVGVAARRSPSSASLAAEPTAVAVLAQARRRARPSPGGWRSAPSSAIAASRATRSLERRLAVAAGVEVGAGAQRQLLAGQRALARRRAGPPGAPGRAALGAARRRRSSSGTSSAALQRPSATWGPGRGRPGSPGRWRGRRRGRRGRPWPARWARRARLSTAQRLLEPPCAAVGRRAGTASPRPRRAPTGVGVDHGHAARGHRLGVGFRPRPRAGRRERASRRRSGAPSVAITQDVPQIVAGARLADDVAPVVEAERPRELELREAEPPVGLGPATRRGSRRATRRVCARLARSTAGGPSATA